MNPEDDICPYEEPESTEVFRLKYEIFQAIDTYLEFINPKTQSLSSQLQDFFKEGRWHGKQGRMNARVLREQIKLLHDKQPILCLIFEYPGYYLKEQLIVILKRELDIDDRIIGDEVRRNVRAGEAPAPGLWDSCTSGLLRNKLYKERIDEKIKAGISSPTLSAGGASSE